jgi:Fe-S cluster biosynthesis and repair protein YggX
MRQWFSVKDVNNLGVVKQGHMTTFMADDILSHISPYFNPLKKHITAFCQLLFVKKAKGDYGKDALHSTTTCLDFINIFKSVFADKSLLEEAKRQSTVLGKRSYPGDLISARNGWDAVDVSQALLVAEPKKNPTNVRHTKFMAKSRKI